MTYMLVVFCAHTAWAQHTALSDASWIAAPDSIACPVFEKIILIKKNVRIAVLTITAHGLYEARLNSQKIGGAYFTPGWTNYNKRLEYQRYDITKQMHQGKNAFNITLSGGWYSGIFGEDMKTASYGKGTALLCDLQIVYKDGSKQLINSDSTWRWGTGPIVYADFYGGEIQNTRNLNSHWSKVNLQSFTKKNLIKSIAPPVTEQEVLQPKRIFKNPKGETIVDFGQNLAGWIRLKVKGKAGDTIRIGHAEVLDEQGNFYTGNLRDAKATDTYILSGKPEILQPHFTYHGFRYARVTGFVPTKTNCTAVAVHSSLKTTGTFSCSDPMLNPLQHNINWSLNSNFVDIPTDCPQRSERFGWTGDAQVFCATASFNRYTLNFYRKWMEDLKADQGTNGAVPPIIPDYTRQNDTTKRGYAGWGDAVTIMPWTLYQVYGNKVILEEYYSNMKAWVDYISSQSRDNLWTATGYGDWYAMGEKTSLPFIDECFYYHSVRILTEAAKVLGKPDDEQTYGTLAEKIKSTFLATYHFDAKDTRTQTAYVLALQFDLLPQSRRQPIADSLAQRIHENKDHLATGFLGTPYLLPVLTRFGYNKLAYTLLLQKSCPSWLYPITKGATTIWERWDAIRPDGTLQQCSFNHYAYGAVGQWLYESLLGIKPASPGFKNILINPHPDRRLKWVKGSYTCRYGKIVSEWRIQGNRVSYHIIIPQHTSGTIALPGRLPQHVQPGTYHLTTSIVEQ